jgi:23S rRNA (adenine2030-N6)-methyltransferase
MNYRHVYHAGNFSDVIKHVIQMQLFTTMQNKDAGFCYIDTHAGTGFYDLYSEQASKTKEYENGIERVIQHPNPPAIIKRYLHLVHEVNNELLKAKYASLRYYPGSPLIAQRMLRAQDHMIACELHSDDHQQLRQQFLGRKQVAVHHTDGYLGLKAFLPPKERRGLILIDPPYEDPDEFNHLARTLPAALKRFESGVYAIWYPIKDSHHTKLFHKALCQQIDKPILSVELTVYPDLPNHLNGSGMVIINPPWNIDKQFDQFMPWLWEALSINKQGAYTTQMLK